MKKKQTWDNCWGDKDLLWEGVIDAESRLKVAEVKKFQKL